MQAPEGEGATRTTKKAVLQSLAEMGDPGAVAALAAQPRLPRPTAYLWNYFQDLHSGRPSNGFGPSRLPRSEIRAWEETEGFRLAPWEVRAIVRLDQEWFAAACEQRPAATPKA